MKKYPLVAFYFIVLLLFLTGCQTGNSHLKEESAVQKRTDSKNGITIRTKKSKYQTSVKEIIIEIQNDSNQEYSTGVHVFLEKKVKDTWYDVPMKAESFTEIGIIHPPKQSSFLSLYVDDLKYNLRPGKYRATIGDFAAPFEVVE